jgi:hypothetical protein
MVIDWFERTVLFVSFVGCVVFVWRFIAADLPEDFLVIRKKKAREKKETGDGGVRNNGETGER